VLADPAEVRIAVGANQIARQPRSYGKGEQIEDATDIQALVERKRTGRRHRAADLLFHAAPASATPHTRTAANGGNLRAIAAALTKLSQRYGTAELQAAMTEPSITMCPIPMLCALLSNAAAMSAGSRLKAAGSDRCCTI
jgi:hypothetical protein